MDIESTRQHLQNREVRIRLCPLPSRESSTEEDHGLRVPLCSATEGTLNPRSLIVEGKIISDNSFTKRPAIIKRVKLLSFLDSPYPLQHPRNKFNR